MIDLHTHILPGLDDGAADLDTALAMARVALADGVHTMAATPHVMNGVFNNSREKILDTLTSLNQELQQRDINLTVLPGAEYYLEPDLPDRYARGELLTINNTGKYLLVELPSSMVPEYASEVLYNLQLQGITPIIAHPERNSGILKNPQILQDLISRGAIAQVTADSLNGAAGKSVQKKAMQFIKQGLVHIIASDAHSAHRRPPMLSSGIKSIEKNCTPLITERITVANQQLIIGGQNIEDIQITSNQSVLKKIRLNPFKN